MNGTDNPALNTPEEMEFKDGKKPTKEGKMAEVKFEVEEEKTFHYDVFQTPPVFMLFLSAFQVLCCN